MHLSHPGRGWQACDNLVNILDNLVHILCLHMLDVRTHINIDILPPVSSIRVHL